MPRRNDCLERREFSPEITHDRAILRLTYARMKEDALVFVADILKSRLSFVKRQELALMNVAEKILDQHRRQIDAHDLKDQRIFVLFERAKEIHRAKTHSELLEAIAEMEKV